MRASEIENLQPVRTVDGKQYVLLLGRCRNHKCREYVNPLYVPAHCVIIEGINNDLPAILCVSDFEDMSAVYVYPEILAVNEHLLPGSPATVYFRKMSTKFHTEERGEDEVTPTLLFVDPRIASAKHVGHPFWQQKLLGFIHDERQTLLQNVYSLSLRLNSLQSTEGVIIQRGLEFKGEQ